MDASGVQVHQGAPGAQLAPEHRGQQHLATDSAPLGVVGTKVVPSFKTHAGCDRRGIWPLWPGARI